MVDYISKFEAEEIDELLQKAKECGSSGGIIDVTELPTENIDENAVYKVVFNQEQQVYAVIGSQIYTAEQYAASSGMGCYIYYVDELPSTLKETMTDLHLYVVSSNGIGYINFMGYSVSSIGQIILGSAEYDRGYTDNISTETLDGIYVTREINKEDWFIRESGEWKRISPDIQMKNVNLTQAGVLKIMPDEGKVLSTVTVTTAFPTIGNAISSNTAAFKAITEECFILPNGEQIAGVRSYAFAGTYATSAVFPAFVTHLSSRLFENSAVREVTFKGTPTSIDNMAFVDALSLTTINVPWSEGEVAGAPWGATNATINYNYTGE